MVAHKVDLAQRTHIMWEKGRYGRGELHPSAKLSAAEHAHIIEDPRSHAAIAKEFGVTRSRVSQIKARNRAKESPQAERLGAEE